MANFKNRIVLEVGSKTRLVLNVEAGVTGLGAALGRLGSRLRGKKPAPAQPAVGPSSKPAPPEEGAPPTQQSNNTAEQSKLRQARQQVTQRDRRIAGLEAELARVGSSGVSSGTSDPSPPIFFVVGLAKSGTSWLMRTLDAHPEILCKGEGRFFGGGWRQVNFDPAQKHALASSLYNALASSDYLKLWLERSVWTREGVLDEHLVELARLTTRHFLYKELAKSDKKIVGDKTPLLSPDYVEEIHHVCPEAKIVHIIRDGRDAAVSMMHHTWNRSSDQGGIQNLTQEEQELREAYRRSPESVLETGIFTEERLRKFARAWNLRVSKTIEDGKGLFGEDYAEVRYEDLLERPEAELGRLAGFLGADTDGRVIEQTIAKTSFEKLSRGRQRGEEDPSSFFRKGVAGDWKAYFTERDRRIFEEEAGELLTALGYEKRLSASGQG